ncbi:MAG TPA: uroporphyrinogen-III synthase [Casimicrobiaceae bacterium]|nr:uroporphyrinogen-III synthase [Casimicrobiaceae bacterium]
MSEVAAGPLAGVGIVVTRPARQAAALAGQIAVLGGKPLVFPSIVILPPRDPGPLDLALSQLASYSYAIFVSANAVEYGVGDPAEWPEHLIAFAPGPGTAAALRGVGIRNVRVPSTTMDSDGLLALPEFAEIAGKSVVIFRGAGGRDVLRDALLARGARVAQVDCYRRARPTASPEGLVEAWRDGRIDAMTITSSEGLGNLWAVLDGEGRSFFAATPTFVPHARIAERARAVGLAKVIVTAPAEEGLLASLLEYFGHARS